MALLLGFFLLCLRPTDRACAAEEIIRETETGRMLVKEGAVKYQPPAKAETDAGQPQPLDFGDALHTLQLARATVRFADLSDLRMRELTRLEIKRRSDIPSSPGITLLDGQIYFANRGAPPRAISIETPYVRGTPRGTEFLVAVDLQARQTVVTMFDGQVELQGPDDPQPVRVRSGEQGITAPGQATLIRPILQAQNIVQWWLYYPGLLELDEIGLTPAEQTVLAASLEAYRQGDLPAALTNYPGYPSPPDPPSDAQRIYLAGLFLAVGAVDRAVTQLTKADPNAPPAIALRTLINAVQYPVGGGVRSLTNSNQKSESKIQKSSSQWLALSYAHQATNNLKAALEAARKSVEISRAFGFGWARVGELEFSFGHTRAAREAALKAIQFSPRNAQAHALNGFLLAAENRISDALTAFDRAIAIDPALGNAWLGRGLCKRRLGWFAPQIANRKSQIATPSDWLSDLQTAAILEPTRSLVRSYAGKAFADAGDERLAHKELSYATKLDPNDPTPWFYSALLEHQENRVNEAIPDLETSEALNDNRALFRSRLLLDQDRAVRSANLAAIYRDAGLFDFSAREASRAVTADYGNYSAHLFLANSYNELRDPSLVNLRYETATFSEYLLANLLSPVGGSGLSPSVSQQEYSRLFEQNRLGITSQTDYSSRGDWQQQVSQFGWFKDTAYAADVFYRSLNGQRPNNDLEQQAYSVEFKQQLTPADSVYVQAVFNHLESGDVRQFYNPNDASRTLRIKEEQTPNLFFGYHHEWSPGIHTLFLGGRLQDKFHLSDSPVIIRGVQRNPMGEVTNTVQARCQDLIDMGAFPPDFDVATCDLFNSLTFQSEFEAYSAELQQIAQISRHTFILGARFQDGHTETRVAEERAAGIFPPYPASSGVGTAFVSAQNFTTDLARFSVYGYDQWEVLDGLWFTGGLTYDRLHYPRNSDSPPVSSEENTTDQFSPKAGLIWKPGASTTVRGAYTKSLGGLFYDASVRLEPSQVAGFNQAFRSLIPESVAGNIPGSRFETADVGLEQKLKRGTYLVLGAEALKSKANRDVGVFNYPDGTPSQLSQKLHFEEHSLSVSLNQLVGREWALGARYQVSEAQLKTQFPDVSSTLLPPTDTRALLHSLNLFAIYNHPSGFFANPQALWSAQSNQGYSPALPGDDFWQFNLFAGYHFPHRQAQVTIGILNVTGQDYRLNPLNLYSELPRHRTFAASFKFSF